MQILLEKHSRAYYSIITGVKSWKSSFSQRQRRPLVRCQSPRPTTHPSSRKKSLFTYHGTSKQRERRNIQRRNSNLLRPRGTRNLSLSIYFRCNNFPRKNSENKKKKEKAFLQASLDSLDRGKKVDRENDRVVPPALNVTEIYICIIIYSLTDDKNRSVESRRWPVAIFTRVSCNDKLISPSISFPEFRLSLRPRGNDIIHVCIHVYRIYALTFQQRERIFPRDLDPRTRWNPVTGYPVSPILAAPPDYSLKPNTRRQTIPCLAAFSLYIYFSLEGLPDVSFRSFFRCRFFFNFENEVC